MSPDKKQTVKPLDQEGGGGGRVGAHVIWWEKLSEQPRWMCQGDFK